MKAFINRSVSVVKRGDQMMSGWRNQEETKKKPRITSRNNSLAISVVMKRPKILLFLGQQQKDKGSSQAYFNSYKVSEGRHAKSIPFPVLSSSQFTGRTKGLENPSFQQIWCGFDRASSLICGNKMPTRCNRWFLLQILLPAAARKPDTQPSSPHHTDNLKTKHQIRQAATTYIILSSSWWWA